MTVLIRPYQADDWPSLWPILQEIFAKGESYAYPRTMTEEETQGRWIAPGHHCFVAVSEGGIVGSSIIKANQPGQGSHVCNGSYVVGRAARGLGVGRKLCLHSLESARELGFKAMQFNLVVSTNEAAIHLWTSCGFSTIGRLPKAFHHPRFGYVDALVMYQWLDQEET